MSNQIVITSGAKVRSLEGVITGTAGVLSSVPLGAANGVATLDSGGKVPVSQLPSSVVTYLGTWNAATNTPTLVNGVGDAGDMYICNVAGTVNFGAGPVTFAVGDWVLYGSGTWQKSNGQNGTVTSVGASITGNAIGLTGSPITTAGTLAFAFSGTSGQYVNGAGNLTTFPTLITSIGLSMPSAFSVANSPLTANGSINVTGAGTTAQYIDGTGALQTFPALTGYVPYTGATADVDLGIHVLNAQALHVKGTAGAGHLGLKHQTATPTGSANESLIFADVNGNLGWQNDNLYLTTLVSNANTANRSYTFPNASGTLALTSDISYPVTSVFGRTGAVTAQSGDYTTTLVTEGTRLYYTDARARAAISLTTTGTSGAATYNSTTGVLNIPQYTDAYTGTVTSVAMTVPTGLSVSGSPITTSGTLAVTLTAGYSIPTTASQTNWDTAYTNRITSATSPLSITSNVISISQATTSTSGYLSSTDWNTFNSKQGTITLTTTGSSGAATLVSNTLNVPNYTLSGLGGIGGSGTTNYLPKFTAGTTIGNSIVQDLGYAYILPSGAEALRVANDNVFLSFYNSSNTTRRGYIQAQSTALTIAAEGSFMQFQTPSGSMRLDASGNLGLGVTPVLKLDVQGNAADTTTISGVTVEQITLFRPSNGVGGIRTGFNTTTGDAYLWSAQSSANLYLGSRVAPNNNANVSIFSDGNVGIGTGTTDAGYKLDVNGTGRFSGNLTVTTAAQTTLTIASTETSGRSWTLNTAGTTYGSGAGSFVLRNNGVDALVFNSSNAATFNSSTGLITAFDTSNANGGYLVLRQSAADKFYIGARGVVSGDGGTGYDFYTVAGNDIRFFAGGTKALTLATTGAATFSSSVQSILGSGGIAFIGDATPDWAGIGYNYINVNGTETVGQATRASWRMRMGNGTLSTYGISYRAGSAAASSWTDYFTISNAGAATFSSTIKTAGFGSTTAQPWKLGQLVTATVIGVNTTGYLTVEVNGSQYNLALANLA